LITLLKRFCRGGKPDAENGNRNNAYPVLEV